MVRTMVRLKHIDPEITGLLRLLEVFVAHADDERLYIKMHRRGLWCEAIVNRDAEPAHWRQVLGAMVEQLNIAESASTTV